MQTKLEGRKITFLDGKTLGFAEDNLYGLFTCDVDTASDWSYVLNVVGIKNNLGEEFSNIINLTRTDSTVFVLLQKGMVPPGKVKIQLKGAKGTISYVSEIEEVWVKKSLNPSASYSPVPSEFEQIEARIQEYNAHPPYPDSTSGYWMIWNVTSHAYEQSTYPVGQLVAAITTATAGQYLSNNGTSTVWSSVSQVPTVSSSTASQVLTNNGSYAYWGDAYDDETYVFCQIVASQTWTINHNLNKYPSVHVVDSGGSVITGDIQYASANQVICTFSAAFSGTAYLN